MDAYRAHRFHNFNTNSPPSSLSYYQPNVQYIARQPILQRFAVKWTENWHQKNDAEGEVKVASEKEENIGDRVADEKDFSKKGKDKNRNTKSQDYYMKDNEETFTKQEIISMTHQQLEYIQHLVRVNALFEFQQYIGTQKNSPKREEVYDEDVPLYPKQQILEEKIAELEDKVKDLQKEKEHCKKREKEYQKKIKEFEKENERSQTLVERQCKQMQELEKEKEHSRELEEKQCREILELQKQLGKQDEEKEDNDIPLYPEQQPQNERRNELEKEVQHLKNNILELENENQLHQITEENQNTLIGKLREQLKKKKHECNSYKKLWPSGGRIEDCMANYIGRQVFNGADTGLLQKLIYEVKEMTASGFASGCAMEINQAFRFEVSCHGCAVVNQRDVKEGPFMIILRREVSRPVQDQISEEIEKFNIPEKQEKICILMNLEENDSPLPNSNEMIQADFKDKYSISVISDFIFKTEEYGFHQCDLNDRGVKDLARFYCQKKYGITVHVA